MSASTSAGYNDIRSIFLEAGGFAVGKLPVLRDILDRLATSTAENLRRFGSADAQYSFREAASGRIGDMLGAYEGNAVAGVLHAPGWDNSVVIGFDRAFMFTMVDAIFGADGSEPPPTSERSFSTIEMRIAQTLIEQVAKALQTVFAPVADTPFKFERLETRMDLAVIGRRDDLAVAAKFQLKALGRGGEMFVVIPQSALSPLRPILSRASTGEPHAHDPAWARQIRSEIQRTGITLRAILEEREIALGEIAGLRVGQILKLQATPESRVKLESSDQPLFWCQLGQSDGTYKLRIEEAIDHEQEFFNDVLSR